MLTLLKDFFASFFKTQKQIVAEDGRPRRLSAGGVVVGPSSEIILVEQHGNSWSLPKGGVEGDESLERAARREIFEETGITDLQFIEELGTYDRYSIAQGGVGETTRFPMGRRTFFLFRTKETDFSPTDKEVTKIRWFTIDEAISFLTHPKDIEFLKTQKEKILQALSR